MSNALGEIVTEIERLKRQVERLSTLEDAPAPWTDYSATSTVTGWSSYTTKAIKYSRVGNLVYVLFNIAGTSNSTSTSFTVPYAAVNLFPTIYRGQDNGGSYIATYGRINSNSTVELFPALSGGNWTASGTKAVVGEFWYVTR